MWTKILQWALVLAVAAVFVLVLLGPNGAFEDVKESVLGVKEYLPDLSLGSTNISAKEALSAEEIRSLKSLQSTISEMSDSSRQDCYGHFEPLPELGEIKIRLTYGEEGTKMRVFAGPESKQIITDFEKTFENVKPCIIAGEDRQAGNFFDTFVLGKEGVEGAHYNHVEDILFSFYDGYFSDANILTVAEKEYGFKSDGWLFKADTGNAEEATICFLPTTYSYYCGWNYDGVAASCFEDNLIDGKKPSGEEICS